MKKFDIVKQAKTINIVIYALVAAVGIFFLTMQQDSPTLEKYLWGGMFIITGVGKMLGYYSNDMYRLAFQFDFAVGILSMILGLIAVFISADYMWLFPAIIGVYIMVDGLLKLQTALDAKQFGITGWGAILATGVVLTLAGLAILVAQVANSAPMPTLFSGAMILEGCANIWITAYTVKVRTQKNDIKKKKP
jgi:uncharacterized membrane protein HdeD (DUF308 family)